MSGKSIFLRNERWGNGEGESQKFFAAKISKLFRIFVGRVKVIEDFVSTFASDPVVHCEFDKQNNYLFFSMGGSTMGFDGFFCLKTCLVTEVDYFDWRGFLQRWVVARVLKEISTWQEMGLPLCLEAQIFGYPNLLGHQIGINWL